MLSTCIVRAINYDERDPFLCTSCGFCKYAKFEFTLNSHPCTSVEAINNEEDRGKALKAVNNALDKADQYYQQLSGHRHALESLLKSAHNQNTGNGKVTRDEKTHVFKTLLDSKFKSLFENCKQNVVLYKQLL